MLRATVVIAWTIALGSALCATAARAQIRAIDISHSVLHIQVLKRGLFSVFAHNHQIEAPFAGGTVDLSAGPSVSLQVHARDLRVLDPDLSAGTRQEIQRTMEGPRVLNIDRFPEISFRSTAVQSVGEQHWIVRGDLTLHGQTSPVQVDVTEKNGQYQGAAVLRQSDFGITPVTIAGGAVKVRNQVSITFDVVLQ